MNQVGSRSATFGPPALIILLLLLLASTACTAQAGDQEMPTLLPALSSQAATPATTIGSATPTAGPTVAPTWTPEPTAQPTTTPTKKPTFTPTPSCDQAGQIVQGRFPSVLAWPDIGYRIYLPPCYGQDGHTYPVLYILPGNVHGDSIWDELGLDEAAEVAIQDGHFPLLLIVMPEGGQLASQTSGGPYSYEGAIVDELIPFIESSYCAWPDPAGRAIGGLSRGGYWSLEIAFRQPAVFTSVGGHGAALVDTFAGPALDPKYTALSSDLDGLRIYLDAGQNDWYLPQLNVLHNNLLAAGREHAWIIQEGGHDNAYWSAHVADYLNWYAEPWPLERTAYPLCAAGGNQ